MKDNGRAPTRVEMFGKVYSHFDGRPSNNVVAEKLEEMKEKLNELPLDYEDVVSRNDVFSQVMGRDKSGYVRLYGDGAHPNDTWSKNISCSKLISHNIRLEKQLDEQAAAIAQLQAQMAERRDNSELTENQSNIRECHNNTVSTRSARSLNEFRVGREVLLKSFLDANKNVARGYIRSIDPFEIVHGCPLGANWFEVEVKAVIDGDEQLIRPYYPLETIQSALGANIAWPKHLVSIYTEE